MGGDAGQRRAPFFSLFPLLDPFPVLHLFGGRLYHLVAKNVRMAADKLVTDGGEHVVHGEFPFFRGDSRMKHRLEHQVPQLLLEVIRVVLVDCLDHLVALLQ